MNIVLFGASGMVGQGALRECLLDPGVSSVLAVARTPVPATHPKLRQLTLPDLLDYSQAESELTGYDACFFAIGVSAVGVGAAEYERTTYGIPLAAATALARLNPQMTFIYISAHGADSTEKSRTDWARVKGKAENALLRLPFKAVYILRPLLIQPLHGIRSRTLAYRIIYGALSPAMPFLQRRLSRWMLTTESLGRAMVNIARNGAPKHVLESHDIRALSQP